MRPEEKLIEMLRKAGVDFTSSLPCEKIKHLLEMLAREFLHVPLTREEEGVGICAGAALAGKRAAMFVQSSGIGNMLNALLSLTGFYRLPLAIFVSQRGIYQERIEAQVPMGKRLPFILKGAGIGYSTISSRDDFRIIAKKLREVYPGNGIHVFLLSPAIWADSCSGAPSLQLPCSRTGSSSASPKKTALPGLTRFQVLEAIAPYLANKVVVCNLGIPSKELFFIKHQPSNFYMLGSMGMATPIGLGISLSSEKEVVVIDGDGSLLMNPGVLATAAHFSPENLTVIAIDNGAYGSTGSQPTLTASCVDLSLVAEGFGIRNIARVATRKDLAGSLRYRQKGFRFLHVPAVPGNRDVPNIPLHHLEIKKQVQEFLGTRRASNLRSKS
jgi:sulfopyruvate decarboxylase beta subunit